MSSFISASSEVYVAVANTNKYKALLRITEFKNQLFGIVSGCGPVATSGWLSCYRKSGTSLSYSESEM